MSEYQPRGKAKVRLNLRIPRELRDRLREVAEATGRSTTHQAVAILQAALAPEGRIFWHKPVTDAVWHFYQADGLTACNRMAYIGMAYPADASDVPPDGVAACMDCWDAWQGE